jgi:hypothetical protein
MKPAPTKQSGRALINAHQDELPLTSVLAHTVFPGRSMLTLTEVAAAWRVDLQHVKNLVECGDMVAIDLKTSKPAKPSELKTEHRSFRQWLRIPTSEHDRFLKERTV